MNSTVQLFPTHKTLAGAIIAAAAVTLAALLSTLPAPSSRTTQNDAGQPNFQLSTFNSQLSIPSGIFIHENSGRRGWLSSRFRLAGTVVSDDDDTADTLAIIDDRTAVKQTVARVGQEIIPGVKLIAINATSVILSSPDGDEAIFMEKGTARPANTPRPNRADSTPDTRAEHANPFGAHEIFPGRWQVDRAAVLDYYAELRDEPERLLSIFDTMDPVYEYDDEDDDDPLINGYIVNIKGEAGFFAAAGLLEGDIVRAVNNTHMSNRRRAEALITRFINDEENTFVLEIERDGKPVKQVYVIE